MEKQHPLTDLMGTAMEKIRTMVDANTIIGTPIQTGDVTLIPVSRLSFGIASGGSDFTTKNQKPEADNSFGGGSGASAKLEPVAPPPATTVDRVIEAVPEVVDKVTEFWEKQQEKKGQPDPDVVEYDCGAGVPGISKRAAGHTGPIQTTR